MRTCIPAGTHTHICRHGRGQGVGVGRGGGDLFHIQDIMFASLSKLCEQSYLDNHVDAAASPPLFFFLHTVYVNSPFLGPLAF